MGLIMAKRGRPPKVNIDALINDADKYIEEAEPPIIAEYAHLHGITRQRLYQLAEEHKELFDTIKKISEAKEVKLEKNALNGKYQHTMAIFSLKQLGWKDAQDVVDEKALQKLDAILGELKDEADREAE
jgi:hypothetical protein